MLTSEVERNLSKLNQDCTGLVKCRQILFHQDLRDTQSGVAGSIAMTKYSDPNDHSYKPLERIQFAFSMCHLS